MNTLKIYFVGVGGQGNVLASKLVGEAALEAGVPVVLSETHGMAQRGGVVESTAVLGGALSPTIADGCADILLAFEPLEAVRALNKIHPAQALLSRGGRQSLSARSRTAGLSERQVRQSAGL